MATEQYFEDAVVQSNSIGHDKCLGSGILFLKSQSLKTSHLFQSPASESQDEQKEPQCPVCKAEISESSLVPLYGRGQTTKPTKPSKGKAPHLGIVIPKRPLGPCGLTHHELQVPAHTVLSSSITGVILINPN
ncbi:hypothetical protein M0R45_030917 [Rubus argutus]|uniref:E3 ubiquitin-protein ligase RMA n=1 Tax=Rubus argutus TaxID=59490 RepID=A0AAW1WFQ3_RUBAR